MPSEENDVRKEEYQAHTSFSFLDYWSDYSDYTLTQQVGLSYFASTQFYVFFCFILRLTYCFISP